MVHLVYCDDKTGELDKILTHEKTMVIRAATGRKIPHSRVYVGETLYFMEKGSKKITAKATVTNVLNYTKLNSEEIKEILEANQRKLDLSDEEQKRWSKKCMCLVEFENVKRIKELDFERQSNMDDWLILEKIEDVVVGTSIPYNYEKSKIKK